MPPEDFAADAHRLALELECLLLSTKDTAALSRWWDSAHDALDQHRQLVKEAYSEPIEKTSSSPKQVELPCTCHPDDNPPVPCAKRYALSECRAARPIAWRWDEARYRPGDLRGRQWVYNRYAGLPPYIDEMVRNVTPLYPHPPRREWQGLTKEEIWHAARCCRTAEHLIETFASAIEEKLKEKNHEF